MSVSAFFLSLLNPLSFFKLRDTRVPQNHNKGNGGGGWEEKGREVKREKKIRHTPKHIHTSQEMHIHTHVKAQIKTLRAAHLEQHNTTHMETHQKTQMETHKKTHIDA